MSKVDKDVAAMLQGLNKIDNANKKRLMENGYFTSNISNYGKSTADEDHFYTGDDIPDPTDAELRDLEASGEVDAAVAACHDQEFDAPEDEFSFRINEGVDPETLHQLVSRYESGEISYAVFKQELEQAEQCCDSDMSSNACDNDFDRDEAEFLEAVSKSQVPAVQRKNTGKDDWRLTQQDLDDEESEKLSSNRGLEKTKQDLDIKETADPDVLAWMKRLSRV